MSSELGESLRIEHEHRLIVVDVSVRYGKLFTFHHFVQQKKKNSNL